MPRIQPVVSKSDLPEAEQPVAQAVLDVFGHIRGPFSMLLHSPSLAERLLPMVTFVREDTIVEPALRFPAILTAARECGSPYVWAAQVALARKHGIRESLIELIRMDGDSTSLEGEERTVVEFVRQLMRTRRIDQRTFDALHARHGAKWMVELAAIVSFFGFVSSICNTFEVPAP
jgi:4-carboxymuconolactone decarboxylase